ncbi:MAG: PAC2 family protein [Ferrimicrobium sp.]|uniref:PAC2 family protein n=1 Tax=Ferrimicrobium sp. TaxID=2926050 RepID=UPI0026269154|nr:PAC2 family protein [Ferrimicrobium sp.]
MRDIVWHRRVGQRRKPATLIAALSGWTDAGDAATIAYNQISTALGLVDLAYLDPEKFYDFSMVRPMVTIDHRGISELRWSTLVIGEATTKRYGPVFFLFGPEPQFRWKTASAELLAVANLLAVDRVITLGSLLAPAPHTKPPRLFGYASTPDVADLLQLDSPRYEGPTGFLSVLQSASVSYGTEIVSLWVEVPHYLSQFPAQRSALALLRQLEILLGMEEDFRELREDLGDTDQEVKDFVSRDPDLVAYISSLESNYEQELNVRSSIDTIAIEAERFLRRQQGE